MPEFVALTQGILEQGILEKNELDQEALEQNMDWIRNGKLITEQTWQEEISKLRLRATPSTQQHVQDALINAIKNSIPKQPFGIFLSGGVDSTLLALVSKQTGAKFTCYGVGMKDSPDLNWARKAAREIGLELKTQEINTKEAQELFRKAAHILPEPDVLGVGVGAVVIAAAELAVKDRITTFLGGLGSEEIFCGYERHLKALNKTEECWRGLNAMWHRDLIRDHALATELGINVITPFLDDDLIVVTMGIKAEDKINTEHKKIILRRIAENLGMPKELAWRKKQAAQYGSKMDWALERCARHEWMSKPAYVMRLMEEKYVRGLREKK